MTNLDLNTASAGAIISGMKAGELRSRDVLEHFLARLEQHNPSLNAVVAQNIEIAREQARLADAKQQSGATLGVLHGLPLTIKDTYEVVGMPTVCGSSSLREHLPKRNAVAVQKMIDAGAIVFGKTNVPRFATDFQSYNSVYGQTNNPWNLQCTPGGSSGGAAAALAAGITPIELGSDIGGSIRTPAHYCGVYGHKPTQGVISLRGHIPGPPGVLSEPDLAVAGPLARCAEDLELLMSVVQGSTEIEARRGPVKLPRCAKKKPVQFRVRFWLDESLCPLDAPVMNAYSHLLDVMKNAGVQVDIGAPEEFNFERIYKLYLRLLGAQLSNTAGKWQRLQLKAAGPLIQRFGEYFGAGAHMEEFFAGMAMSYADWQRCNERRWRLIEKSEYLFSQYDVLLTPIVPTTAITHDNERAVHRRQIRVNGRTRPYTDHLPWIALATALGLPATSAPIAVSSQGMPINIQIVGARYRDANCLAFAKVLASLTGPLPRPGAFS